MKIYPGERLGIQRPEHHVTTPLNAGIERAKAAVRPEVWTVPEIHQTEYVRLDAPPPRCGIALEEMELLEPLENPEGEVDLDVAGIEDLPVETVRQGFVCQKLADFGDPAHSWQTAADTFGRRQNRSHRSAMRPSFLSRRRSTSRLFYGTRYATMLFWGAMRLPSWRIVSVDALGCFTWAALLSAAGYFASHLAWKILGEVKTMAHSLLAVGLGVGAMLILSRSARIHRKAGAGNKGKDTH